MSRLTAFTFCLAGFAALAFATRRQQRDLFGGSLRSSTTYVLRLIGACALALALWILVAHQGWCLALVMFSGHTTMAAGLVLCGLVVTTRIREGVR